MKLYNDASERSAQCCCVSCGQAPDPAWKGGARIAYVAEHKDPAALRGRFWHADGDSPDAMHAIEYGWTK